MTARSEVPSTSRSTASSARMAVHPAMAQLFDMADRRYVGWLNVTDLQVGWLGGKLHVGQNVFCIYYVDVSGLDRQC